MSLLAGKRARHWACGGVCAGSALGLVFAVNTLHRGVSLSAMLGAPLPELTFVFGADALSSFFLMVIFGLALVTGVYTWGYTLGRELESRILPFFPLLVAAMTSVVTARDGFLFLVCWEVMSLASFFLVCAEHESREVRHAGWVYLAATHLATAFLLALFVIIGEKTGSFRFADWSAVAELSPSLKGWLFVFALVGFGTKAGFFPFHVWLPHAHPAAPSYVSALMSGVMIKTGIYGLLRILPFLGPPPMWWGATLIGLSLASALLGILYASVQGDIKKLLAYSSVENIGIIGLGLGLGVMGLSLGHPPSIAFGFGGALLHVLNHAVIKSLLFMAAGAVVHATRTRSVEHLGGLMKKMPVTGGAFLTGVLAISGLPPLGGFIGEFLIYVGLFHLAQTFSGFPLVIAVCGIVGMAFTGGLAVACFAKAFGIVFLGEARGPKVEMAQAEPLAIKIPLVVLGGLCLIGGILPQWIWPILKEVMLVLAPVPATIPGAGVEAPALLANIGKVGLLLFALGISACVIGRLLYRGRTVRQAPTWDCGYSAPTPRMQYTASSFSQPVAVFFRALFRPVLHLRKPDGIFPGASSFAVTITDLAERDFFQPLFRQCDRMFGFVRQIQKGRIQNYLALIFFTLVVLLLWEALFGI